MPRFPWSLGESYGGMQRYSMVATTRGGDVGDAAFRVGGEETMMLGALDMAVAMAPPVGRPHSGCSLASLTVKHIDRPCKEVVSFLDPKEVASFSDFTQSHTSLAMLQRCFAGTIVKEQQRALLDHLYLTCFDLPAAATRPCKITDGKGDARKKAARRF